MNLNDFTLQKNMNVHDVPHLALIWDEFDIDSSSMLGSFLVLISCAFRHRFFDEFSITVLTDFWPKWLQKMMVLSPAFVPFFNIFPQGVFLKDPCALLASILIPFAYLWLPLPPFGNPLASIWIPLAPFWFSLARFWFLTLWRNFLEHFQRSTRRQDHAPWPSHPTVPMGPKRNLACPLTAGAWSLTLICCLVVHVYV